MTDHTTTTRIFGSLRSEGDHGIIRVEDRYDTGIDDLWSALTEPARLARWVAEVHGDLQLDGTFHARFTSGWDGPGHVSICEPPQRLVLTMGPEQGDQTVIEALLTPEGDRTYLVIEERGLPTDELAAHGAGWQAHLEDLASYLEGRDTGDWHTRWTQLIPTYDALAADLP
jgi:uncharacterized protein YndB with AHSA1/START domain